MVAIFKPVGLVAGALVSPGTLQNVVLFTVVAAAELLLNDSIFTCPCAPGVATIYGLSFLLVPAIILLLADFPWKLFKSCPSIGVLCSVSRRPIGLAVTWIIIGCLQRKYVDCILEEKEPNCDSAKANGSVCCEDSVRSSWFQLVGLYIWLIIVIASFGSLLCRRQRHSCMKDRYSAKEMQARYDIEERIEREHLTKKIKYGTTRILIEEELKLNDLQTLQAGLNPRTYEALRSEELLQPSVLVYLREEDLAELDVSVAQRCILRALVENIRAHPQMPKQMAQSRRKTGNVLEANAL